VRRLRPRLEILEDRTVPATLLVTQSGDDGTVPGTLRYAVGHAVSGDTILISATLFGTPIVLTNGELLLNKDLTIESEGTNPETVSGGGTSRVFEVAAGVTVSLENLIIKSGSADNGGGILNAGTLTVQDGFLSANTASGPGGAGGGIYNDSGTLLAINSVITGNAAPAGADLFLNGGMLINIGSTIGVIGP
jgi:hypothetical protein